MRWSGEWAAIGGGSRGLGLAIAHRAAAAGLKVALVARDIATLEQAAHDLRAAGSPEVRTFAVDLAEPIERSDPVQMQAFQRFCESEAVSFAVAAVGRSDRGYLDDLAVADVHAAIAVNVAATLQFSQLVRPAVARGRGSLVHIASIAGLVSAPGMGCYSLSKAALVAMSRQMRQEYRGDGIAVTTVCTGPIAREDAGRRYDDLADQRRLPEHLKNAGGGVKLSAIDPRKLAAEIFEAAKRGTPELVVPRKVRLLAVIAPIFPSLADRIIARSFPKSSD